MTSVKVTKIEQPEEFKFSHDNMEKVLSEIAKYPNGKQKSAVMALLHIAQKQQGGWIAEKAIEEIAGLLHMIPIEVMEVATFYTMYKLQPMGKYHIDICRTASCKLCGANKLLQACKEFLGIDVGEVTEDGVFSISEVECLGACINAPVAQLNGEALYEDLDAESILGLLKELKGAS